MTEIKVVPDGLEQELQATADQIKKDPTRAQILYDQLRTSHPDLLFWDLKGNPTLAGAVTSEDTSVATKFIESGQLEVTEGALPASGPVNLQVIQPQVLELTRSHEVLSPMKVKVLAEIKPEELVEVTIDNNLLSISKN